MWAAGSTAHAQRSRSSWNVNHGSVDRERSTGQNGRDRVNWKAAQAIAEASSIWR